MSLLIFFLVLVAVIGSALYHISEKGISKRKISPIAFIAISAAAVFAVFLIINLITQNPIITFSWELILISLCSAIIDTSIIYIYKYKGRLSLVVNVQNSMPSVLLVFIGVFFFAETMTIFHILGIIFAIVGISLIMEEKEMEKYAKRKKNKSAIIKVIILLFVLIAVEVIYQISFKLASSSTDTLSAISTIFFFNIFEYMFALMIIKISEAKMKKNKKILKEEQEYNETPNHSQKENEEEQEYIEELKEKHILPHAAKQFAKDIKHAVTSIYSYLFAVACLLIVLADYLLYKNGGDLSKVMNYIAPLETITIAIMGVLIYKEKLKPKNIIGIVLALAGIILLSI